MINFQKSWTEAEKHCQNLGGHLAAVTNERIHNFILSKKVAVWVGGTDQEREDRWVWSDCSVWEFTFWGTHKSVDLGHFGTVTLPQPNNGRSGLPHNVGGGPPENCLQIYHNDDNKWHDVVCHQRHRFMCSKKLCPTRPQSKF